MSNLFVQEDFEQEPTKESVYLQEKEHELWLWWNDIRKTEEGEIITIENDDITEVPEFIRERLQP